MKQGYNAMIKSLEHYLITHLPRGIALVLLSFLDVFCVVAVNTIMIMASGGFLIGTISLCSWIGYFLGIDTVTLKTLMHPVPSALAVVVLFVSLTMGVLASYSDMSEKIPQREKKE